ncbi:MAG: NADH-quinone oxidoreductase subunit J [Chitinophagales bacterium]
MTQLLFYFLSAVAIGSSLLMLFQRNAMYSVLYLLVCFFAVAGLYIMLNAQFLAIVHVIVYAGAIMVLFVYVLMFLNLNAPTIFSKSNLVRAAAVLTGGMVFTVLFAAFWSSQTQIMELPLPENDNIGSVQVLGKVLFNDMLIPFELTSVLFISAMVGVVIINKKESHNG